MPKRPSSYGPAMQWQLQFISAKRRGSFCQFPARHGTWDSSASRRRRELSRGQILFRACPIRNMARPSDDLAYLAGGAGIDAPAAPP